MPDKIVHYEEVQPVALLRLDDGKANALSWQLIEELAAALERSQRDAKAVVIAGRPGRFCAGFDLRMMLAGIDQARQLVTAGGELLLRLYELPQPVVIACTGHALAAGALLLLVGDSRVGAAGDFKIGLNEVSIGMPLPIMAMELARDRLDPLQLAAATLQATVYDPNRAAGVGYLDRVTEPDKVIEEATAEAKRLAALAGPAYGATKQRLRERTVRYVRETLAEDMARLTTPTG